ncbi:MAG: hypothetical protein Q9204_007202 [Flavoplaca sp. TL-2023a]
MEVSAKGNINIEKAFYSLAADIKKRIIDTSKPDPGASQGVNVADQSNSMNCQRSLLNTYFLCGIGSFAGPLVEISKETNM